MSDTVSQWEELLDELRGQRLDEEPARSREMSAFAAGWLEAYADQPLSPTPEPDDPERTFEPYLGLLRLFARLNRGLSEMLYRNTYAEMPPMLGSDFGDWAVGSLARETYLDLRMASWAFYNGLDLQAMSLLRQMAELAWRALIVVGDPGVADEWWGSIVATSEGEERAKLEKRLWQRHFRPAAMLRHVAEIETRLDGTTGEQAEVAIFFIFSGYSEIYTLLSGTSHGGTELVYASVVRGGGTRLPEDPFARIGSPTELGKELVSAGLYLQTRFWRYFCLAAFPDLPAEELPPITPQGALALSATAVERLVTTHYSRYVAP